MPQALNKSWPLAHAIHSKEFDPTKKLPARIADPGNRLLPVAEPPSNMWDSVAPLPGNDEFVPQQSELSRRARGSQRHQGGSEKPNQDKLACWSKTPDEGHAGCPTQGKSAQ